ncbi:hypothetical protein RhiirA1_473056 [Rhizophagus irregularis]|uniref:Uncharacterized protein n=1 Tax=Rhizophagus irregularis TaxID=588596 RepID=A0A2N0R195_9GLOM|nr:hypothetical protein RhiirA1_473056 [Rhizophagus irregularis]
MLKNIKTKRVIYDYQETEEINKEFFDQTLINSVEMWHEDWPIQDKWEFHKRNLIENKEKFIKKKEIITSVNPRTTEVVEQRFTFHNFFKKFKKEIRKNEIKTKLENIPMKIEDEMGAVERHCNDLNTNQRRMIDSITEKEIKKIHIDMLLIKNNNNEDILITDTEDINSKNRQVEIFDDWINEYISKDNIQ